MMKILLLHAEQGFLFHLFVEFLKDFHHSYLHPRKNVYATYRKFAAEIMIPYLNNAVTMFKRNKKSF